MSVKAHKVISMNMIHLYCDDCNTQISNNREFKYSSGNWFDNDQKPVIDGWFEYTCPNCGKKYKSKAQFPYQSINYDTEGHEYQDENEVSITDE